MSLRCAVGCAVLVLTAGISSAQTSEPRDSWLMQNYRFTGPPPPGQPTDPVISQLQEIQNTTLAILRKANFAGDYEAALAAAAQAAANAQLIDALTERRQQPAQSSKTSTEETPPKPAVYLIALRDRSIQAATSYWTDGTMLHCITLDGSHEQIRLDLVDRERSTELNHRSKVEFRLPDLKQQSY